MDIIAFLTAPISSPGPLWWVFLLFQIGIAVIGAYLAFIRPEPKQVWKQALQRLGYAMIVLGVLGVLVAGLLIAELPPFNTRLWSTIVVIFELALLGFWIYYQRTIYPEQAAAFAASAKSARRVPSSPQTAASTGANGAVGATQPARNEGAPSRRESRRERKRRKK